MSGDVKLWLDDMRSCPMGWVHVKTVEEAKWYLERDLVEEASLDHDLGACEACMGGLTAEEWLYKNEFQTMPHCDHFGTGYTLVCWMEETGHWPTKKPKVHSANPAGRKKMQMAIDRKYDNN